MSRRIVVSCLGVCSLWLACTVPRDTNTYEYAADGGSSLGLSCDPQHTCGDGLVCRSPSHCTREADVVQPETGSAAPPDQELGALGDGCEADVDCESPNWCEAVSQSDYCTAPCQSSQDCPDGGICWTERGPTEGWCVRAGGLVGDACALENDCAPGLFCENRAAGGYCTMQCGRYAPCPAGMDAICTKLSGDFGNYCLKRCDAETTLCREDVGCRKMTKADVWVCFPSF